VVHSVYLFIYLFIYFVGVTLVRNFKIDNEELGGGGGGDWIDLAQDADK